MMLAGQDLVANLYDQPVRLVVEPLACVVRIGRRLLQDGIGGDHLARDEVLADAEMLERPLGLRAPQLIGRHVHFAETVGLLADVCHGPPLWFEGADSTSRDGPKKVPN